MFMRSFWRGGGLPARCSSEQRGRTRGAREFLAQVPRFGAAAIMGRGGNSSQPMVRKVRFTLPSSKFQQSSQERTGNCHACGRRERTPLPVLGMRLGAILVGF